jgi:NAD(P)H-dependent FMN reductase
MKILALSGSLRSESYNTLALTHTVRGAREAGADVTVLDLADFALPIYHGDLEAQGMPAPARALKTLFKAHQGLLIASPEYNGSLSPLLKNTLDWVSRAVDGESGLVPYAGKFAGIVAASSGVSGGQRGLRHLREILTILQVIVLPRQHTVAHAGQTLASDTPEAAQITGLETVGRELAHSLARWHQAT